MNKRQVIIFWVIAIVFGGAVAAIKLTQKPAAASATQRVAGQPLFAAFPATDIATVEIQGATDTVTLTKKDGKWTLVQRDGYPANATYVNEFIRTLGDLKVTRALEAGPSLAPRFGMDEASAQPLERGLTATFKDAAGKELVKVSLGKSIESAAEPSPMGGTNAVGRYIRNHADSSAFYAVSEMFPSVTTEVPRWLADDFISPEKIQSITLSQKGKDAPEWILTRESETAEFKLDGGSASEVLDAAVGTALKTVFSYARFEDVVAPDKAAERSDVAAKRNVLITTVEGFTYALTVTPAKASATKPPAPSANQPAPDADKFFLTVDVKADLPKERKKEEGEKPEDAKIKDSAFSERLKTLTEKLDKEKSLAGRTFEVSKTTVDALLKDRAQIIAKATPPPAAAGPQSGSVQSLPGGIIATPPVEATTPPLSVAPDDVPESSQEK